MGHQVIFSKVTDISQMPGSPVYHDCRILFVPEARRDPTESPWLSIYVKSSLDDLLIMNIDVGGGYETEKENQQR